MVFHGPWELIVPAFGPVPISKRVGQGTLVSTLVRSLQPVGPMITIFEMPVRFGLENNTYVKTICLTAKMEWCEYADLGRTEGMYHLLDLGILAKYFDIS